MLLRPLAAICAAGSAVLATGCASIVNGQNQSLSVQALSAGKPLQGASCTLANDKGTWYLTTPGSAVVQRSFAELSVKCEKPDYEAGSTSVKSSTKAMAFGNILFGGLIGVGVDVATGAAYDYPNDISVALNALGTSTSPAMPAGAAAAAAQAPATAAMQQQAAEAAKVDSPKAEYLVYRVTDKLTKIQRSVRVPARSKLPQGTGDMEMLSPPEGWVPQTTAAGTSWTMKYTAKDGAPPSQVAITGQASAATTLRTAAGEFEAVPIVYKGWIDRAAGPILVAQPAEFRLWLDSKSNRVLRFESDIPFRSSGPNQARASQEQVELIKLAASEHDE